MYVFIWFYGSHSMIAYGQLRFKAYIHLFAQFISTDEYDSESANSVTYYILQS